MKRNNRIVLRLIYEGRRCQTCIGSNLFEQLHKKSSDTHIVLINAP